jgi:hypothetical protein
MDGGIGEPYDLEALRTRLGRPLATEGVTPDRVIDRSKM